MRVTVRHIKRVAPEKVIEDVVKITEVGLTYMIECFDGTTHFFNRQSYNLTVI